jgi:hypothetical protein
MKFTEAQLESVRFIDPRGQTNMESEPEAIAVDSQRQFATRCPNTPKAILNMESSASPKDHPPPRNQAPALLIDDFRLMILESRIGNWESSPETKHSPRSSYFKILKSEIVNHQSIRPRFRLCSSYYFPDVLGEDRPSD